MLEFGRHAAVAGKLVEETQLNSTLWMTLQSNEVGNAMYNKYNTGEAQAAFAKQSGQTGLSVCVPLFLIF